MRPSEMPIINNTITTREGDTISRIAYEYYGQSSGMVEQIMIANPKLSREAVQLPAGLTLVMPKIEQNKTINTINLWD